MAKGSYYERAVREHIRDKGRDAEGLKKSGTQDEGDISHRAGPFHFILEAKNKQRMDLASAVDQAVVEAANYRAHRRDRVATIPAAVVKRPRKGVGQSYVVLELDEFLELTRWVEDAYAVSRVPPSRGATTNGD